MNKQDFENIRGKKIAIHCETREFLELAYSFDFSWGLHDTEEEKYWKERYIERNDYKGIYYSLTKNGKIKYTDKSWYVRNGYKIVEFTEFKGTETMNKTYMKFEVNEDGFENLNVERIFYELDKQILEISEKIKEHTNLVLDGMLISQSLFNLLSFHQPAVATMKIYKGLKIIVKEEE